MFSITNLFQQKFLGNTLDSYLWFAGILLIGLLFKRLISKLLSQCLFSLFKRYFKSVGAKQFIDLLTIPVSYFVLLFLPFCFHSVPLYFVLYFFFVCLVHCAYLWCVK